MRQTVQIVEVTAKIQSDSRKNRFETTEPGTFGLRELLAGRYNSPRVGAEANGCSALNRLVATALFYAAIVKTPGAHGGMCLIGRMHVGTSNSALGAFSL